LNWIFAILRGLRARANYPIYTTIKKKFGDGLKSKNYEAQVNELLCKCIAYNVVVLIHEMEELGVDIDFKLLFSFNK